MEMRSIAALFPPSLGGPRKSVIPVIFPRDVLSAGAGMIGYSAGFVEPDDRELGELQVGLETKTQNTVVNVEVTFSLRDWSGEFDDETEALIQIIVLAELETAEPGPTREDLIVTGLEYNQATQFFRSAQHLDLATAQNDNAIPLVAQKPAAIRVYVDYDAASPLPPISLLSGLIRVATPTASFLLAPTRSIVPRLDFDIDRGDLSHTLLFILQEQYCRGDVTLECSVFDESDPAQV